jgi:sensor histidine kinase regulating citrate/malate metabolism
MKLTPRQAQYLCDRLLSLGESIKNEAWHEIKKGFRGVSDDYAAGVLLSEQVRIFRAGMKLEIPEEWRIRYSLIIEELKEIVK